MKDIFVHRSWANSYDRYPSALIVAIDWRWREAKPDEFGKPDHYMPTNEPPEDRNVINELLSRGAKVEVQNSEGLSPLQLAAWQGKSSTVELLLKFGADLNFAGGTKKYTCCYPLRMAILSNSTLSAKLLANKGADIDKLRDENGDTAISLAKHLGNKEIIAVLEQELSLRNSGVR